MSRHTACDDFTCTLYGVRTLSRRTHIRNTLRECIPYMHRAQHVEVVECESLTRSASVEADHEENHHREHQHLRQHEWRVCQQTSHVRCQKKHTHIHTHTATPTHMSAHSYMTLHPTQSCASQYHARVCVPSVLPALLVYIELVVSLNSSGRCMNNMTSTRLPIPIMNMRPM